MVFLWSFLGKRWRIARLGASFGSVGTVATADGVGESLARAQLFPDQLRLRVHTVLIDSFLMQFLE